MASISAPTSLTTFPQPHASSSKAPHVRLSPVVGDLTCAVAAVQGDGVWTYDLSTLRATTSFTVPPTTVFTTAPVSYWATKKVSTLAADDGGMDVDEEEDEAEKAPKLVKERVTLVGVGKEVWVWRGEDGEKEVVRINFPVKGIHHLPSSTHPILVISSSSRFHLLDTTFVPQTITRTTSGGSDLLASRIVSPSSEESIRVVVVDVNGRAEVVKITLGDRRTETISEGKVGKGKLVFADVNEDGVISALDDKHNLFSIPARDLSAPSPTPIHLLHPSAHPILLPLPTSSLPLLVLPTPHPSPSLLLTVPSSSLPSVLTSTPLSSFTSSGTISSLAVLASRGGVHTLGVVLSHTHTDGDGGEAGGRSVVYICEAVVPERGVGMAMLLGTQLKTMAYFASASAEGGKSNKSEAVKAEDGLVSSLEAVLKRKDGAAEAAEKVWKDWSSKTPAPALSDKLVRRVLGAVFSAAVNDEGKVRGAYVGGVVRDLVGRGLVSDGMWKGGVVVDGLLPVGDWETILLALDKIPTLPSSSLPPLLTASLHPSNLNTPVPTLPSLLQHVMAAPPPGPTFKRELHQGLSVEDATAVLEQLVVFAEAHVEARSGGLAGWDVDTPTPPFAPTSTLPSLTSTIHFSSSLLDAHLPTFISHPPSHPLLTRLQLALEPLLALQNEYRQLRGPVEALLTLARREARKEAERAGKGKGKGKKGRKEEGARLPEEVVGKWKVEDLVF